MLLAVQITRDQLRRRIPRSASHTAEARIHHDGASGCLQQIDKANGQGKGELLIVVRMETEPDCLVKLCVHYTDDALQVLRIHRTKRVNNGQCDGRECVDLRHELL